MAFVAEIPSMQTRVKYKIPANTEVTGESLSGVEYTPPTDAETEEALKEWVAFAQKCGVISNRRIVPFDPYPFQRELFKQFWKASLTVVGKPRQHGLTETVANIFLFRAHKDPAYSAAIFAKNQGDTRKIAERVRRMAIIHPDVDLSKMNTEELRVEGGGSVLFRASTVDGARGLASLNDILCDEFAFVRDAEALWSAVTPAQEMLGAAAKQIIVSTPPPPEDDPDKQTFYIKMLCSDNGDRDIVRIANQMRSGDIDPVQYWLDDGGACKFLLHWRGHPVYSKRNKHLESIVRRLKISQAVCNREHDLAFDARLDEGIVDLEWFGRYSILDLPENPVFTLQSWDTASTTSKKSSYTAGITLLLDGGKLYVADLVHKQMLSPDVETAIRKAAHKWKANLVLIESKSSGLDIIPRLQRDTDFRYPVKDIQPYTVKGEPGNAKLIRFEQEIPKIRDEGSVMLPEDLRAPKWLGKFLSEISKVGTPGADMDIADALSQALKHIRETYAEDDRGAGGFGMRLGGKR